MELCAWTVAHTTFVTRATLVLGPSRQSHPLFFCVYHKTLEKANCLRLSARIKCAHQVLISMNCISPLGSHSNSRTDYHDRELEMMTSR